MQRKTFFSYIDTALRVIYVNLQMSNNDKKKELLEYINTAETSTTAKSDLIQRIIKYQIDTDPKNINIFQHEFHHYWQSLFYPFLYLINIAEYTNIQFIAEEIRNCDLESIPFDELQLSHSSRRNLTYLTAQFNLIWENQQLGVIDKDNDRIDALQES